MASIKMCDIDGTFFVERAPGSVRINNAVVYDIDTGKPQEFSGELCPSCGLMITTQRSNPMPLAIPQNIQDKEG